MGGQSLFDRLAQLACPTVAAIHGVCVGGGLEFALAFDGRIASDDRRTQLGLPEVKLGLIPGWGGTVRLPRLIGVERAAAMICSGELIGAVKAQQLGLLDGVAAESDLVDAARRWLVDHQDRRTFSAARTRRNGPAPGADQRQAVSDSIRPRIESQSLHPGASTVALQQIVDSCGDDLATAEAKEAEGMARVYGSESNAGLLHAFFLDELGKKLRRGAAKAAPPATIGIVGAGWMGSAVAHACPAGQGVRIFDTDAGQASRLAAELTACGQSRAAPARAVASIAELADCDLVLESVVESLEVKRAVLSEIEAALPPGASSPRIPRSFRSPNSPRPCAAPPPCAVSTSAIPSTGGRWSN